jgi:hypothetical protein
MSARSGAFVVRRKGGAESSGVDFGADSGAQMPMVAVLVAVKSRRQA